MRDKQTDRQMGDLSKKTQVERQTDRQTDGRPKQEDTG